MLKAQLLNNHKIEGFQISYEFSAIHELKSKSRLLRDINIRMKKNPETRIVEECDNRSLMIV